MALQMALAKPEHKLDEHDRPAPQGGLGAVKAGVRDDDAGASGGLETRLTGTKIGSIGPARIVGVQGFWGAETQHNNVV